MDLLSPDDLTRHLLIFVRIGAILFALPIFGDQPTPVRVRIFLAVAMTLVIAPLLPKAWFQPIDGDPWQVGLIVVKELLVGLCIGFVAKAAFEGLVMAATFVGFQMGFGTAGLFIPDANMQMDAFTAFHRILVLLIFLVLNFHHLMIQAIYETFLLIPGGKANFSFALSSGLIQVTGSIFSVALQLAAPVLIALMFATAALGLMARAVPQLNVFTMSFPFNFSIGLVVYLATLPFFPNWLRGHFSDHQKSLLHFVQILGQ